MRINIIAKHQTRIPISKQQKLHLCALYSKPFK